MKFFLATAVFLFVLLSGCHVHKDGDYTTPLGLDVQEIRDEGSFSSGRLDIDQVLIWLDDRFIEWLEYRQTECGGSFDHDYLWHTAHAYHYVLIDDYHFQSPLGPAAGMKYGGLIFGCIWLNDGLGGFILPSNGIGLAVIPHELDHAIGIDHNSPLAHW